MKRFFLISAAVWLSLLSILCWYGFIWNIQAAAALSQYLADLLGEGVFHLLYLVVALWTLGCVVFVVASLFGKDWQSSRQWYISNESGPIGLSLHAIEEFLTRKHQNLRGLRDMNLKAYVEDDQLCIRAKVVLELQRNVPDFIQEFQQRTCRELSESLGLDKVKHVEVIITKLLPSETNQEPILLISTPKDQEDNESSKPPSNASGNA